MMHRRDLVLGMILLAVISGMILLSLMTLMSSGMGGLRVTGDCVGIIEITGTIVSPMATVQRIERCIDNDNVLAIVIRLNTPGGGISATQEIFDTVLKARFAGKPVIASMGSVAASGGYYIAAACDTIVATPGTITGSIGVIANFMEMSTLLDKIGIRFNVRKSGDYKDMGSIAREMTEEEKALIDGVIMDSYEQFVEAVSEGRSLDPEYVREYADGRIFTGRQAQKLGFVDYLGTYQDAINLAGDMAGLGAEPPVLEDRSGSVWDILLEGVTSAVAKGIEQSVPRIAYLWMM